MKLYNRRHFLQTSLMTGLGLGLAKKISSAYSANAIEGKRIGIIGLDGSHAVAFTKIINDPQANSEYLGYKVVAAYPKGSRDIESSVSRVPRYTKEMQELGIEIMGSIEELLERVDAVFMVTNDGRRHLEQALMVFASGKRMFIDKPMAASLKDGLDIFAAAKHYNVPVYSSSNTRFAKIHQEVANGKIGKVIGADVYGPSPIEETHPTLFWYGIHSVEALCTIMGTGCKSVMRVFNQDTDITVGKWPDNRLGVNRAIRVGQRGYGGTAYGEKTIVTLDRSRDRNEEVNPAYKKMIDFFYTGIVPVTPAATLEVLAFMEAAEESMLNGGNEVKLETVMQRAINSPGRLKL